MSNITKAVFFAVVLFAFFGALASCVMPAADGGDKTDIPNLPGGEEKGDLFVTQGDGSVLFEVSDSAYWGPHGYSLWGLTANVQTPFVSRETELTKLSGEDEGGYGMVFCHYDTGDPLYGETMLVLMIRTAGDFIVGEVNNAQFTALFSWTPCKWLIKGKNQKNTVKIELISDKFVISINGEEVTSFRDEDFPLHAQGADGYIAIISGYDQFPECPVKVVYKDL